MTSQSTQELTLQDIFAIHGKQIMTEIDMQQLFEVKYRQKEQLQNRASDLLSSSLTL